MGQKTLYNSTLSDSTIWKSSWRKQHSFYSDRQWKNLYRCTDLSNQFWGETNNILVSYLNFYFNKNFFQKTLYNSTLVKIFFIIRNFEEAKGTIVIIIIPYHWCNNKLPSYPVILDSSVKNILRIWRLIIGVNLSKRKSWKYSCKLLILLVIRNKKRRIFWVSICPWEINFFNYKQ